MACKKLKFPGKDVVLEYVIGCPDVLPTENEWKRFGSLRTKEFEVSWDTADASDSDSVGSLRENIATFQSLTISGDGTVKASGAGAANLIELTKHVFNPVATGGQPAVWLRMTFPDLTFTAYTLIATLGRSAPHDDTTTYNFEASATASDFGLIVEDTPDPDASDPTSVEVVPSALSLKVGQSFTLAGVVMPSDAPQSLRFTSSSPTIASVDLVTGRVTGLAVGTSTITAASAVDGLVTDTCSVTVTA